MRHLSAVTSRQVTARAPGKVNLLLNVGPVGPDGYHPLVSLFQAVGLTEDVTVSERAAGSGIRMSVSGDATGAVPLDSRNIAWHAAEVLAQHVGRVPDVAIHIDKGVPVAGGMAGGSADAAATLVALDELWETRVPRSELMLLAGDIGSDVPFCMMGGTAMGTGRGNLLTPAMARGTYQWAFASASKGLSTPAVYRTFDIISAHPAGGPALMPEPDPVLMAALRAGDPAALGGALRNDLQSAALHLRPELARTMEVAREGGALGVMVSGSGPTIAALASSEEHARMLATRWESAGVAAGTWIAQGPVPGARVLTPQVPAPLTA
ncbi:MAG: 4-(cytidine 5'-diphospho)-2-C-methyl-D-erythritol kinase [Cellulomonadaceae bacterium]|jgi:4-diphosphocytidyl-2-C-methyl-D-erythritol kinase|nr:4-(cytidine 5'-diphospho)-2-C-methyl-D-erythritol kinase [Cellulomonadaceae bacterium]